MRLQEVEGTMVQLEFGPSMRRKIRRFYALAWDPPDGGAGCRGCMAACCVCVWSFLCCIQHRRRSRRYVSYKVTCNNRTACTH